MDEILQELVDFIWGLPLVLALLMTGILLTIYGRALPLKGFSTGVKALFKKNEPSSVSLGQISHFKALTNALSATVGMGNIAGVAIAIHQGGPGAIFWMWVAALLGMNTKFFECTLSMMYRGKDYKGQIQGGPMYVIEKACPKKWLPLAYMFAFCGLIGTTPMFNANQLSSYLNHSFFIPRWLFGLILGGLLCFILWGGLKRISQTTSQLVPLMCVSYLLCGFIVAINHLELVPGIFGQIFYSAFNGIALWGGGVGLSVASIMTIGIKRSVFSTEAGLGTAPMAHSNAQTNEPVLEGLVAMLGPFIDTIVVSSITAIMILLYLGDEIPTDNGILLTAKAFTFFFKESGVYLLSVILFLFSFTTMIGTANYGKKCWDYIFRGRWIFTERVFILWYSTTIFLGSIFSLKDVINLIDICYGLMVIPNLFSIAFLYKQVKKEIERYFIKNKEKLK